jgi:hypothetical protein
MESTSYVGEIVIANVAGVLSAYALLVATPVQGWGLFVIPVAGPVVHLTQGNPGRAAGSFLIHIAAPILGGIIGAKLDPQCDNSDLCIPHGVVPGVLGGLAVATVIDGFMANTPDRVPSRQASVGFTPLFSLARSGGATVGLAARF